MEKVFRRLGHDGSTTGTRDDTRTNTTHLLHVRRQHADKVVKLPIAAAAAATQPTAAAAHTDRPPTSAVCVATAASHCAPTVKTQHPLKRRRLVATWQSRMMKRFHCDERD